MTDSNKKENKKRRKKILNQNDKIEKYSISEISPKYKSMINSNNELQNEINMKFDKNNNSNSNNFNSCVKNDILQKDFNSILEKNSLLELSKTKKDEKSIKLKVSFCDKVFLLNFFGKCLSKKNYNYNLYFKGRDYISDMLEISTYLKNALLFNCQMKLKYNEGQQKILDEICKPILYLNYVGTKFQKKENMKIDKVRKTIEVERDEFKKKVNNSNSIEIKESKEISEDQKETN